MELIDLGTVLDVVSGNVVGEKRFQPVLRALLAHPVGTWHALAELDRGGTLMEGHRAYPSDLLSNVIDGLRLAWTQEPEDPGNDDLCLILFYYGRDGLFWNNLALFNRRTL